MKNKISILRRAKNWITRSSKPSPDDDFWYDYPGQTTKAGTNVSEKTAIKYLTLFACVSLISADLARLPLILYRRRKDEGKDHKLIINAISCKLVNRVFATVKRQTPYVTFNHQNFV